MTDDVSGAGAYRDQTNDEKHHDALNDVRRLLRHGCNILGETGQSNRRREPSQDLQISACDSDPPRRIRSPAALPLHSSVETTELAYEGREFHLLVMLEHFKMEGLPVPTFDDGQMADLVAYLHSEPVAAAAATNG